MTVYPINSLILISKTVKCTSPSGIDYPFSYFKNPLPATFNGTIYEFSIQYTGHLMKKLIYFIEDNFDILNIFTTYFINNGYDVFADWNADAMHDAKSNKPVPDIYIIDVTLDDRDGIDLCLELQRQQPKIPVIIVSGNEAFKDKALLCGASAFVTKPFDLTEILYLVEQLTFVQPIKSLS